MLTRGEFLIAQCGWPEGAHQRFAEAMAPGGPLRKLLEDDVAKMAVRCSSCGHDPHPPGACVSEWCRRKHANCPGAK